MYNAERVQAAMETMVTAINAVDDPEEREEFMEALYAPDARLADLCSVMDNYMLIEDVHDMRTDDLNELKRRLRLAFPNGDGETAGVRAEASSEG